MFRLIALSILAMPALAFAQAPALVPVQGFLTTDAGEPVDGAIAVRFSFYDGASDRSPVFTELQTIDVDEGFFDAYVGDRESLDLSIFDGGGAAHLGIQIEGDAEMVPRVSLGTSPFAAFAERAGDAQTLGGHTAEALAVPSGAIMMFNRSSCPDGWSSYSPARGRAIVGSTGTGVGGTVGTPLSNREDRTHTHSVDPLALATTTNGAHTHTVDPAPVRTSSNLGGTTILLSAGSRTFAAPNGHDHDVDIPRTTSSTNGSHSHVVNIPATESTSARTSDVIPYIQLLICQKS